MACSTITNQTTKSVIPTGWTGSTYLNSAMATYSDVAFRIRANLGAPTIQVEIDDAQIATFIDQAIEVYTKYAGFTKEYLVFCTDRYIPGCGIKMDEMIQSRCIATCVGTTTALEVTSTSTTYDQVATTVSLVSAGGAPGNSTLCITYDPSNVWAFNPCNATHVLVSAATGVPAPTSYCGPVSGLMSIAGGVVTIYPYNYATLEASVCTPLSAYWGCDISSARNVIITDVPPCTVGGQELALTTNNGKVATVTLCNTALNTYGPMPATFEFVTTYEAPSGVYGLYPVPSDGNLFRMCTQVASCLPNTASWTYAQTTFFAASTVSSYGITYTAVSGNYDPDLDAPRKVTAVLGMDRSGTFGGLAENTLYGMDYAIAQNLWMGSSLTTNLQGFGFDFVTYELMGQYVEMARRMLARSYEVHFNPDTQFLKFYPEPPPSTSGSTCTEGCRDICFVSEVFLEKPVRHLLKERWVLNYVLALTMISLGHIRGKFGAVTLFGGGTLNGNDMLSSGQQLLEKMETELLNNYGDSPPPAFFVG